MRLKSESSSGGIPQFERSLYLLFAEKDRTALSSGLLGMIIVRSTTEKLARMSTLLDFKYGIGI